MTYWRRILHEDRFREHRAWIHRGRTGDGRLVLVGHDLREANTSADNYRYARIERCIFDGASLVFAHFEHAEIFECSAIASTFARGRYDDAHVEASHFERSDLSSNSYVRTRIRDCSFDVATLTDVSFISAIVIASSFCAAQMENCQIDGSHFAHCNFRDVLLAPRPESHPSPRLPPRTSTEGTHFEDCDFRGANFDKRRLNNTTFTRCKFAGITGTPIIEGPYELINPDFSVDGDGSDVRDHDALRAQWGG